MLCFDSQSTQNPVTVHTASLMMDQVDSITLTPRSSATATRTSPDSPQSTLDATLAQTFENENEFELFIDWMHREFSSEILLSVIEFSQFKSVLEEYRPQVNARKHIRFFKGIPARL